MIQLHRTWVLVTGALVLLAIPHGALAEENTTMNESEFNTTAPEGDDSYLEDDDPWSDTSSDGNTTEDGSDSNTSTSDGTETSSDDGNLTEGDFDTSLPAYDDSYLDVEWLDEDTETSSEDAKPQADDDRPGPSRTVPGIAPVLALLGMAALAGLRRR